MSNRNTKEVYRETQHFNATPHCDTCFDSSEQSSGIFVMKVKKKKTDLCFLNFVIELPDDCSDKQKRTA